MTKAGKKPGDEMAEVMTAEPAHLAASTMETLLNRVSFSGGENELAPTVQGFVEAIQGGIKALDQGDLAHLEAILYAQSETLNTLFHLELNKAQSAEYVSQVQLHTDMALKAQNHCRRTVLAITDLKQPRRATFIEQQHNTLNQQISSENKSKSENEVLEGKHGNQLEPGSAQTAIGHDAGMETLDLGNGAKNTRGEKALIQK